MATITDDKRQPRDKKGKNAKPGVGGDKGILARAGKVAAAKAKREGTSPKERVDYFGRTRKYFQGVMAELKRVHWPGPREVAAYTVVVLVSVAVLAVLMWIFDSVLGYVFHIVTGT